MWSGDPRLSSSKLYADLTRSISPCHSQEIRAHIAHHSPLKALLLLTLLADLRELALVVLPRAALLGFASWVVLHAFHLLFPGLHQLVVALADFLFLLGRTSSASEERPAEPPPLGFPLSELPPTTPSLSYTAWPTGQDVNWPTV